MGGGGGGAIVLTPFFKIHTNLVLLSNLYGGPKIIHSELALKRKNVNIITL